MKWERKNPEHTTDYLREDGCTVQLNDFKGGMLPEWILCTHNGRKIAARRWQPTELEDNESTWLGDLLSWADDVIAKWQP